MGEAGLGSGAVASRAGAAAAAPGSARVGMFPPVGLLEQGPETVRALLAQVSDAGIDHVCCGDHIGLLSMLCSARASSVPLAESPGVVRFRGELLDRLGLDADMSKLPTGWLCRCSLGSNRTS